LLDLAETEQNKNELAEMWTGLFLLTSSVRAIKNAILPSRNKSLG
jgi:hypothetical protein